MRRVLVVLIATLAAVGGTGCSNGTSHAATHATESSAAAPSPVSTTAPKLRTAAARIVLPKTTMRAGSSMQGRVVLQNNTGHALHATGCGFFAVALVNAHYRPKVAFASCAMPYTFPVGASQYAVTVYARNLGCNDQPVGDEPACVSRNGHPDLPPLPTGVYQATLFQISRLVPTPPAVTVRVTN